MTKTITCAADLIDHPELVGFCHCWQRDIRCPIGFADWLREQGLWKQGSVADWASQYEDRRVYTNPDTISGGPTPELSYSKQWRWQVYSVCYGTYAADLKTQLTDRQPALLQAYATFAEAIAALLDHYTPS